MQIQIVIPAYNEAAVLDATLRAVTTFCANIFLLDDWQVVVADNASADQTAVIARQWEDHSERVGYMFIPTPGKGEAVITAWRASRADVYCFMDADLATDLSALPRLIAAVSDGADVAIGSRALPQSRIERSFVRRIISAGYRLAAQALVGTRCTDLPCGFKAINQRTKEAILPSIENKKWFFDSELVLRAEEAGYRITEVPIDWAERRPVGNKSRVAILSVATAYVRELLRMRRVKNRVR